VTFKTSRKTQIFARLANQRSAALPRLLITIKPHPCPIPPSVLKLIIRKTQANARRATAAPQAPVAKLEPTADAEGDRGVYQVATPKTLLFSGFVR
jgi:hypothetical protein